jgi:hypothetical protein
MSPRWFAQDDGVSQQDLWNGDVGALPKKDFCKSGANAMKLFLSVIYIFSY